MAIQLICESCEKTICKKEKCQLYQSIDKLYQSVDNWQYEFGPEFMQQVGENTYIMSDTFKQSYCEVMNLDPLTGMKDEDLNKTHHIIKHIETTIRPTICKSCGKVMGSPNKTFQISGGNAVWLDICERCKESK